MIFKNFVELHCLMLHAKFQNHRPSGSGEKHFLKVFAMHSHFWSCDLDHLYKLLFPLSKASISLACEFLAPVLRILSRTFARHLCECRASVVRIFLCRKLVAKFFKMLKKFMRFFSPKYFARLSRDVRASVVNLSLRNFGEFTMCNFRDTRTNVARVSHNSRATVLRKPRDYLARK